jgi:hypothetical protein
MQETRQRFATDLRSATYLIAIDKVALSYMDRGIFP